MMTSKQHVAAKSLWKKGVKVKDIAKAVGVSHSAMSGYIQRNRAHFPRRIDTSSIPVSKRNVIARLADEGKTYAEIAEITGCHLNTVAKYVRMRPRKGKVVFADDLAERLREAREQAWMTQKELAQKVGVSANCISQYECGRRVPNLKMVSAIACVLDVSLDTLVPKVFHEVPVDHGQTVIFDYLEESEDVE